MYEKDTGNYYIKARYYDPAVGRWLSPDTHWNVGNMIYGDNPQDPLGLNIYTPDIHAIMQSSNLYVYCMNNPILFYDPDGEEARTPRYLTPEAKEIQKQAYMDYGAKVTLEVGTYLIPGGIVVKAPTTATKLAPAVTKTVAAVKPLTQYQQAMQAISKGQKLTNSMKDALRTDARKVMQPAYDRALKAGKQIDAIHHLIPLEYAHLMGSSFNPNAITNLVGVSSNIHGKINASWNAFRVKYPNPTKAQINAQVAEVNRLFSSYYMK